jgi:preprotein translocase subunit SecD
MKHAKLFVSIIIVLAVILFFFDLPNGLPLPKFTIPFTQTKVEKINLSDINLNVGAFHFQKSIDYKLGLDLQGGAELTYQVDMSHIPQAERDSAFESARNIIEKRVNFFGVSEPTIESLKMPPSTYRIIVQLPGATNVDQAISLIGKTAQLSFWEPGASISAQTATPSSILDLQLRQVLGAEPKETKLTGKDLKQSQVTFDQQTGQPQVQLTFTSQGTKLFGQITSKNVGKPVAIVLDNQVIQAPIVNEAILNGNAVINGSFTTQQANDVVIQLNAGALPAPLHIIGQSTIGPSLGILALKESAFAGIIGFITILIFMSYLYRREGLIASVALVIYVIIMLALFKIFSITLTLAGIAGFILSIGMAVDANILIFERMKEERRAGRSLDVAKRIGFSRAWTSIRDSNFTSIIVSLILFYFGTGIVRGFAIVLLVGIIVSMFSAIVVTRNLLAVLDNE